MPKDDKTYSLSKRVVVSYGNSMFSSRLAPSTVPKASTKRKTLNKTASQIYTEEARHSAQISSLSFQQRDDLIAARENDLDLHDTSPNDDSAVSYGMAMPPPGEEGIVMSNAGGDLSLTDVVTNISDRKRGDFRTRNDRIQRQINAWQQQMEALVDVYLLYTHKGRPSQPAIDIGWELNVIGIEVRGLVRFDHPPDACFTSATILRYGYVSATPDKPMIAFSVELLEWYRQLRRVCPRFSLDAFRKALNHFHKVTLAPYLADQISNAFDCYLEILRHVQIRARTAHWMIAEAVRSSICPPCLYTTDMEPLLKFRFLATMDGNNSLKLVDPLFRSGTTRMDNRDCESSRWMSPAEVDAFKDEVEKPHMARQAPPLSNGPDGVDLDQEEVAWLNVAEHNELARCLDTCVDRWKNAGPESRKKMFALFAVAGIFLCVCRHGHLLVICDMIRSGELMKYPLAIVNRLIDDYGTDICLGYDIMCAFTKTLSRSSLGPKASCNRLAGVVPSFHRHAHNRGCQVHWHPLQVDGVGLEDFEECERTFNCSNELASVTRMATTYHRFQHIEEHFRFHDADKHLASGNFIYQNYRQALEKIDIDSRKLSALSAKLKTTSADYEQYLTDERQYLWALKTEPIEVVLTADYMELLHKLYDYKQKSDDAAAAFHRLDQDTIRLGYNNTDIKKVNTLYRTTFTRFSTHSEVVLRFEEENMIAQRWLPMSQEYLNALKLMTEQQYRRSLDNLERLVVQRLFELAKLGQSGVGYKLREKITKSLKTCMDAIQTALRNYNSAAVQLEPPRPTLTWETVVNAVNVADPDILRDTRTDISTLQWAEPARREGTVLYFGIKQAKEEIVRLNVEIRRLLTFMRNKHNKMYSAIAANMMVNPPLASYLSCEWQLRDQVNSSIARRLVQASKLYGFSGSLFPGKHLSNNGPELMDSDLNIPPPFWYSHILCISKTAMEVEEPEDDALTADREPDIDESALIDILEEVGL